MRSIKKAAIVAGLSAGVIAGAGLVPALANVTPAFAGDEASAAQPAESTTPAPAKALELKSQIKCYAGNSYIQKLDDTNVKTVTDIRFFSYNTADKDILSKQFEKLTNVTFLGVADKKSLQSFKDFLTDYAALAPEKHKELALKFYANSEQLKDIVAAINGFTTQVDNLSLSIMDMTGKEQKFEGDTKLNFENFKVTKKLAIPASFANDTLTKAGAPTLQVALDTEAPKFSTSDKTTTLELVPAEYPNTVDVAKLNLKDVTLNEKTENLTFSDTFVNAALAKKDGVKNLKACTIVATRENDTSKMQNLEDLVFPETVTLQGFGATSGNDSMIFDLLTNKDVKTLNLKQTHLTSSTDCEIVPAGKLKIDTGESSYKYSSKWLFHLYDEAVRGTVPTFSTKQDEKDGKFFVKFTTKDGEKITFTFADEATMTQVKEQIFDEAKNCAKTKDAVKNIIINSADGSYARTKDGLKDKIVSIDKLLALQSAYDYLEIVAHNPSTTSKLITDAQAAYTKALEAVNSDVKANIKAEAAKQALATWAEGEKAKQAYTKSTAEQQKAFDAALEAAKTDPTKTADLAAAYTKLQNDFLQSDANKATRESEKKAAEATQDALTKVLFGHTYKDPAEALEKQALRDLLPTLNSSSPYTLRDKNIIERVQQILNPKTSDTPAPSLNPLPGTPAPKEDKKEKPAEETKSTFDTVSTRLAGETMYDTMQKIVQKAFPNTCKQVVLATGESYYDALSANSLAGSLNAPVLLTTKAGLPEQTINELKRLKPEQVFICGGTNAISNKVADQLKDMKIKTERLAGQWADDTANDIAKKLDNSDTAVVATSWGFEDALSAASFAYSKKAPIFLASYQNATLSAETIQTMKAKGVKKVYIVGGAAVVSSAVEGQLKAEGIAFERVAGETAYDTSAKLATKLISLGMSVNNLGVATGWGYADALSGAALCGQNNSIMLLADDGNQTTVKGVVKDNKEKISNMFIFGGDKVVGGKAVDALKEVFNG